MDIKKIEFFETKSVIIQVNNLKKSLIEANVVLGKKFTLEMATLVVQIEKLISYYDSKKLSSRFNSNFQALELTLSNESIGLDNLSKLTNQLNLIKTDFDSAKTNEQKKYIMFKLLFFHLNVLFFSYQTQESIFKDLVDKKSVELSELRVTTGKNIEKLENNESTNKESLESFELKVPTDKNINKLTKKQRQKYLELLEKMKTVSSSEKNKVNSSLNYYIKLMNK